MGRRLMSRKLRRGAGVGVVVGALLIMVAPVGAQTRDEPRLSEPVFRGQVNPSNAVTTLQGSVTNGLYAAECGWRNRIRAVGGVCHLMPSRPMSRRR